MRQLKIKFRNDVTLTMKTIVNGEIFVEKLEVAKGTKMMVERCRAFVDNKLLEHCNLSMPGNVMALGVRYADFNFLDE